MSLSGLKYKAEYSILLRKRREGRIFASQHNLPITAKAIGYGLRSKCYGEIFDIAIKELGGKSELQGFRKIVALLKEHGSQEWIRMFWFHTQGARMQHFDLKFRCEIWSKLAWMIIRSGNQEDIKEAWRDLYNPFYPRIPHKEYFGGALDSFLSERLFKTLKAVAA